MATREPLLNVDQAAELLGLSPKALRQRCQRRTIPFVKLGRSLRFDAEAIRRWIDQHVQPTNEEKLLAELVGK